MYEQSDSAELMPPGTYLETIAHPGGEDSKTIELAIFKEHRFAFYFWNRWLKKHEHSQPPPHLVTIDWHRDLAPPSDAEKKNLNKLDLSDPDQVAQFIWSDLNTHNDSHLLSAAYLNLISNIFLLKNYGEQQQHIFIDRFENEHRIYEFKSYEDFQHAVLESDDAGFFLDIDLDYFIKGKVSPHQLKEVTPYNNEEIATLIDHNSPLFQHIFPKLNGITIAAEPRYCGGILKSNRIMESVLSQLFTEELQWKHLSQE